MNIYIYIYIYIYTYIYIWERERERERERDNLCIDLWAAGKHYTRQSHLTSCFLPDSSDHPDKLNKRYNVCSNSRLELHIPQALFFVGCFLSSENSYTCFVYLAVVLGQPAGLSTEVYARAGGWLRRLCHLNGGKSSFCAWRLWRELQIDPSQPECQVEACGSSYTTYLFKSSHHPEHLPCFVLYYLIVEETGGCPRWVGPSQDLDWAACSRTLCVISVTDRTDVSVLVGFTSSSWMFIFRGFNSFKAAKSGVPVIISCSFFFFLLLF